MRRWQGGQSLVLLMVFLVALSAAFVYLYNTGNVIIERTRLSAAADHVSYGVATEQARLLNLNAYINRAAIANQLAVAQNVSIASWGKFMQPVPVNASATLSIPPVAPMMAVVVGSSQMIATAMNPVAEVMGIYVLQNQAANIILRKQQQLLNRVYAPILMRDAPTRILEASGRRAEGVKFRYLATTDRLSGFVQSYHGDDRQRLAPVMMASRDPFTTSRRSWNKKIGLGICKRWLPNIPHFELLKRGGTQLLGLDEWKGMDTFSLHTYLGHWKRRKLKWKWICDHTEFPVGYGSAVTSRAEGDADTGDGNAFNGSWGVNPQGSAWSAGMIPGWDARAGKKALAPAVPEHDDLRPSQRERAEAPTLDVVIALYKQAGDLQQTGARSQLRTEGRLQSDGRLPGKRLMVLSRAEVYFERPYAHYLNRGMREKASLFNPYWRVRLSALRARDRLAARGI